MTARSVFGNLIAMLSFCTMHSVFSGLQHPTSAEFQFSLKCKGFTFKCWIYTFKSIDSLHDNSVMQNSVPHLSSWREREHDSFSASFGLSNGSTSRFIFTDLFCYRFILFLCFFWFVLCCFDCIFSAMLFSEGYFFIIKLFLADIL